MSEMELLATFGGLCIGLGAGILGPYLWRWRRSHSEPDAGTTEWHAARHTARKARLLAAAEENTRVRAEQERREEGTSEVQDAADRAILADLEARGKIKRRETVTPPGARPDGD